MRDNFAVDCVIVMLSCHYEWLHKVPYLTLGHQVKLDDVNGNNGEGGKNGVKCPRAVYPLLGRLMSHVASVLAHFSRSLCVLCSV